MRPRNAALKRLALLALALLGLHGCASGAEHWFNRGVKDHHGPDSKISHYTNAIELKPDYAFAYINRGEAYNMKGLPDEAIADLTKAITLLKMEGDKHHLALAFAYNNKGNAYRLKGQYDWAIRDSTEAIRLKPDFASAFYNRGVAYYLKGQYDRAIRDSTEAITLKADYAIVYISRGNAYNKKGLHDKAIADETKAITLLKKKVDKHHLASFFTSEMGNEIHNLAVAYSNRGGFYQEKGLYDRAIANFHEAIEVKPYYAYANGHLAWLLATAPDAVLRNGKQAVELAERAVNLDRDAHNLDAIAAAYAEMGWFEEAIETQLQAIALLKKEDENRYMADFQKHLERYKAHKPWRMNVPGGGPDYTTTFIKLNDLAEQYRAQGKVAEAEPLYKRALAIREKALGPQHQDVATSLDNLAELYRAQGKVAEAEPLYKRALAIREEARQQEEARKLALVIREEEEARKREKQQRLEALSGRYVADGGRSQWDISFRDNRFEARILNRGKWDLLYDGTVTGTWISGRVHHGSSSICRQSPTTKLYGNVDLRQKTFVIFWGDYNSVKMIRHKRCVQFTNRRKWTQADRQ